jgi:hypothetical protein
LKTPRARPRVQAVAAWASKKSWAKQLALTMVEELKAAALTRDPAIPYPA